MRSTRMLICVLMAGGAAAVWTACSTFLFSAKPAVAAANLVDSAHPEGQTFIGTKRCASCHFDQFTAWKKTKHSTAYEGLTAKYQTDAKCLKCHTTGLGEPTGFKDIATTPNLAGISCEMCHGAGSKHEEIAKPLANVKKLSPEQDKAVRESIWKMLPKNICVECHNMQAHKESQTPPELRKK